MICLNKVFLLLSFALLFSSCSKDSGVIDSTSPQSPVSFTGLALSESFFDTDTISVIPEAEKRREDPVVVTFSLRASALPPQGAGVSSVASARCRILLDGAEKQLASFDLAQVQDGFAAIARLHLQRGDVGEYRILVEGKDNLGRDVNPIFTKIRVVFGNRPPAFCGLTAPDTLNLPASGAELLRIEACVMDSSGQADIQQVFFNSFKPDDKPSLDNPVYMFDDGTNGDLAAGDGIYTREVVFPYTALKGKYRFEFQAFDFNNLTSEVKIHYLTVR